MLIAANKNKLRIHNENKVDLIEDEITSTIFGPLRYFPATAVWYFFEALVKPNKIWPDKVERIEADFKFWPTLKNFESEKTPDLIIKFSSNDNLILQLIIEIKWASKNHTGHQWNNQNSTGAPCDLAEQWSKLRPEIRKRSIQIYLAWSQSILNKEFNRMFDKTEGLNFEELKFNGKEWKKHLIGITWAEMAYCIQSIETCSGEPLFNQWLEEVADFLNKFGIQKFTGFSSMSNYKVPSIEQDILFWRHFNGFNFLKDKNIGFCNKESSIFYKGI